MRWGGKAAHHLCHAAHPPSPPSPTMPAAWVAQEADALIHGPLGGIVSIRAVWWGNANRAAGQARCQHGPAECCVNRLHSCATELYPDIGKLWAFLICAVRPAGPQVLLLCVLMAPYRSTGLATAAAPNAPDACAAQALLCPPTCCLCRRARGTLAASKPPSSPALHSWGWITERCKSAPRGSWETSWRLRPRRRRPRFARRTSTFPGASVEVAVLLQPSWLLPMPRTHAPGPCACRVTVDGIAVGAADLESLSRYVCLAYSGPKPDACFAPPPGASARARALGLRLDLGAASRA